MTSGRASETAGHCRPFHCGVQLRGQHATWEDFVRGVSVVEGATTVEELWVFDHLLPFEGPQSGACFETLTTLGALAVLTERARIGVLVASISARPTAVLAKSIAQIDEMTDGRAELGVGAGWAEAEARTYGLAFDGASARVARLDEGLTALKLLWTQEVTHLEGRFEHLVGAPCRPRPVQRPHPPITVGGSGDGILQVVARHADRWNVQGTPDRCYERGEALRAACRSAGRDDGEIEWSFHSGLAVAATRRRAGEIAEAKLGARSRSRAGSVMAGTPDDILALWGEYRAVGFSHWVIGLSVPIDPVEWQLLEEEILPVCHGN